MFSCSPSCFEPGIRHGVRNCALISPPQSLVERSIQEVKIEPVGKTQETPQMRAKPQLRLGVQVVEGSQSTKPENGHFRILHKRSIQITPVRGQNSRRCAWLSLFWFRI